MKPSTIKCGCGRVSNPLTLMCVTDAWLDKDDIAHFEFDCPQCTVQLEITIPDWTK